MRSHTGGRRREGGGGGDARGQRGEEVKRLDACKVGPMMGDGRGRGGVPTRAA